MKIAFLAFVIIGTLFVSAYMQTHHTPHVTVCHSQSQTHCLWIDGKAEWH